MVSRNELPHPWDQTAALDALRTACRRKVNSRDTLNAIHQFPSRERAELLRAYALEHWPFITAAGYTLVVERPDFTWDLRLVKKGQP